MILRFIPGCVSAHVAGSRVRRSIRLPVATRVPVRQLNIGHWTPGPNELTATPPATTRGRQDRMNAITKTRLDAGRSCSTRVPVPNDPELVAAYFKQVD